MAEPVDVVLPCLDEAAALPWVLSRMPAGYRTSVADNGAIDGSADSHAAASARVVAVRQRGVGAAAHAGWRVSEVEVDYAPRAAAGRSKVTGTVLGPARTIADMSRVLAR